MFIFAILILIWVVPSRTGEYDYTVEIPPGKFQCYFQPVDISKHTTMEVDYQVIDGADLNINFMVLLGANILIQDKLKTDGSHRLELQLAGDYQVCFDNSFSYQARKVVFFEIFLFDANGNLDDLDMSGIGHKESNFQSKVELLGVTIADFHTSANHIKNQLNKIEYHQALLRAHEARDRAIMVANLDRVTFWSVIHTLVLLSVGAIQVYIIRSLFEDSSKVAKGGQWDINWYISSIVEAVYDVMSVSYSHRSGIIITP
uniref:GOLD domain-containing protein n=1 Tax=Heterorhabditis bacteriophora TaxID=37862 RepID=A0A1I7XRE7_HETBA